MRTILTILVACLTLGISLSPGYAGVPTQAEDANSIAALAQEQRDRGQFKEAESNYRKALAADPLNTIALNGLLALYRQQGLTAKVQLTIAQLTPAQRNALGDALKRIESAMLQDQAELRLAKGQDDQAIKFLEQAVQVDADDLGLHARLAGQYARRGSRENGLALLEDYLSRHPDDAEALYALAQYQADSGDTGNALKTLDRIGAAKRSPDMTALQHRLTAQKLLQGAKSLMQAGKEEDAYRVLAEAEAVSTGDEALTLAAAFAWAEIGNIQHGRALFNKVQASHATPLTFADLDRESRAGLIKILDASGNRAQALQQLEQWSVSRNPNDIASGVQLGGLYADLGEYDRAKKIFDAVLAANPDAAYVLYDAWKLAQRSGHADDEIDYLKKLVIAEPAVRPAAAHDTQSPPDYATDGIGEFGSDNKIQRDWKEKKLAALIDRRARWFSAAMDVRNRTGTAGLSEFHSVEIPLEYKTPWHMNDGVFFRADLIKLDAGSVAPTGSDFGSMLLCQPACASATLNQAAQGMSLTAGYQNGEQGADIGITPSNFPVSNVVGGIWHKGDLGPFGYSLEASRRPITASLLSYAGSRDPNTGKVWGGVAATGARLGVSLDSGETFGFWSSLGLHSLTGRNAQTNRRMQLMAGEQWRIINEENRRFVIGLTGMYWNFSENAGEYSYGHGGYYSPHIYRSLALPITYAARSPRFSYMLRAAVSVSGSQTKDAPFYPTDSAMQAIAGITAKYSGGTSGGRGYALKGAWEYQLRPRLFIGGLLAIDRSESYAPNQAVFYLRYAPDHPGAQPVFLPPEPLEPSSQFF